jgi:8-oxo-dGTP diphosphatase
MVDAGEAPHECVSREVAEELGLDISTAALLVVDWIPPQGDRPRVMTNCCGPCPATWRATDG